VQDGRTCWLCDHNNPSRPTAATDQTSVRADLLRLLITGGSKDCGMHESGVTLYGGWIEGPLDLAFCTALGRTALHFCRFPETPRLEQASFHLLSLQDSQLDEGLFAQDMRVTGSLFLNRLVASGTVDVNAAQIGGQLTCTGAILDGNGSRALNAQGANITQSLFLSNIVATGTMDVAVAQIGRQFDCTGAILNGGKDNEGRQQPALFAQGVGIGESLLLRSFQAIGTVAVNGATIDGQFDCKGATLNGHGGEALDAQRLQLTQGLFFRDLELVTGRIDLTSAHVGDLVDHPVAWPSGKDQLILDGFTYDRIVGPTKFADRQNWLRAGSHWQGEFLPQPYTQFARVLRQMGHAGEARKVLIERTWHQGEANRSARKLKSDGSLAGTLLDLGIILRNCSSLIFDRLALLVVGYGHAPLRSLWSLLVIFLLATTLADFTWKEGSFAPNSDVVLTSPGWASVTALDCFPVNLGVCDPNPAKTWANAFTASADAPTQGADWDSFNRYGYAADLVVPFLDLGQTDAWAPSKDRGPWGWWLWWMRWILAAAGWIATGLGVAAVTGVMQRNQPE
jgi:hypothetical protein